MTFWTDKAGNKLTFKEFMARWKKGLEGITALQQVSIQLKSSYLTILGLICGIFISIIAFTKLWWVLIILVAALINSTIVSLGLWQKKLAYEKIDDIMKMTETYETYTPERAVRRAFSPKLKEVEGGKNDK